MHYPVLCRINGDDYAPSGGVTAIDSRMISVALEKAGSDAIIFCWSSGVGSPLHDQTMASPRGSWVYMAEGIKKTVNIPVMVARELLKIWWKKLLRKDRQILSALEGPISRSQLRQ